MALRKALANRPLIEAARLASSLCTVVLEPQTIVPLIAAKANFHREYLTSTESAGKGFFGFLHMQSASKFPDFLIAPVSEKLREKLRGINIRGDRLLVAELIPSQPDQTAVNCESMYEILISYAKKIMRLSQVEKLKAKLREIPASSISYSKFVQICSEGCENEIQGAEFAKTMDESGNVIVLGNVVFL